jgi:hypothetical protein
MPPGRPRPPLNNAASTADQVSPGAEVIEPLFLVGHCPVE